MHESLSITATDSQAIKAVEHFEFEFVSLGKGTIQIIEDGKLFPDIPLIQIYAALFHLYAQTKLAVIRADRYLRKAEKLQMNRREKSLLQATRLWQQGHILSALAHLEKHCDEWPKDLPAIKIAEFLFYCAGQKYLAKRFLQLCKRCYSDNKENAHFLSTHSFALELNNHFSHAKDTAEKSIGLDPQNPWAYHTLTHFYLNTGAIDQGIKILEKAIPCWKKANRLIESHNLWHLALLHLENLDYDSTFAVYKTADWDKKIVFVGEEIDAAALLWRMDMHKDNTPHWHTLAEGIGSHANFPVTPFNSADLLYALKRGGKETALEEALVHTQRYIDQSRGKERVIWKKVGEKLIDGSLAFAEANYSQAADILRPIIEDVGCVGGSDAQIALFYQTYLVSLIRSRRHRAARAFLKWLYKSSKPTPRQQEWLASCSVKR